MKRPFVHIILFFIFAFPLFFQPLHVFIHHFGNEHIHRNHTEHLLFDYQTKCPICHYEFIYNTFFKSIKRLCFKQNHAEKIILLTNVFYKSELNWFKTSRAPPV